MNNDQQQHIQVIGQMLAIAQKHEGDIVGTTSAALIAAKSSLERNSQMEALLEQVLATLDIISPPGELHEQIREILGYRWHRIDGMLGGVGVWKKEVSDGIY